MGAEPWDYFVPYEVDVQAALEKLRQREFQAGHYRNYSRVKPATISAAVENADASGTASILDMERIGDKPAYSTIVPLSDAELVRCFGTTKPTREMIEDNMAEAADEENDLYENIGRGHGIYVIAYKDDKPSEIFFGGYSFD